MRVRISYLNITTKLTGLAVIIHGIGNFKTKITLNKYCIRNFLSNIATSRNMTFFINNQYQK